MKNYSNEIAEIEAKINEIDIERFELLTSNNLKIQEVLDDNFNQDKQIKIKVFRDTASFHIKDESDGDKEIFNLNFYGLEGISSKPELKLSYYTTSTQNDFELTRLIMLGNAARIIKLKSEFIINQIVLAKKQKTERSSELYSIKLDYEKQIREYKNLQVNEAKIQVELDLRSEEGIKFDKDVYIELKRNFTARVCEIKIIEVKGKTCTVEFEYNNFKKTESRVNIESLIKQVQYYVSK